MDNLVKSYGRPYPWDVRMKIMGTTERRTCEIAVKELNLPVSVDEFHHQYQVSCLKNLGNAYLLKGTWRLRKRFSGSADHKFKIICQELKLDSFF